jgi:DNA-binding transcriptional LysR family regulator
VDFTHLKYFRAIADTGSLSAAARAVGVSQPTLTVAMRQLEKRLGTTLFTRDTRGVRLTSTGRALREHAAEILATVDLAEQNIRGLEDLDAGHFVIGCHESLGAYFLPGFLPAFTARAPKIAVTLWTGPSAAVADAVVQRRVDFGLVVNPRPHPDLVIRPLFHDAMDFFVLRAPKERPLTLADAHARLRRGPLVHAGRVFQCRELIERLAAAELLPSTLFDCGDLELVKSLALAGFGVALLPRRVADYGHPGALRRLHPELPFVPDSIALVHRPDAHRTKAYKLLKTALTEHGQSLDP